jgi:predicted SprT family Zn-dependent metalloprotease
MALRCPYCGYAWKPRLANPATCPRCKRYPRGDKVFEIIDDDVFEQSRPTIVEVEQYVPGTTSIYQCYACPYEDKKDATVKIGKHHYCAVCASKLILGGKVSG